MREIKFRAWDKINKRMGIVMSLTMPEQTPFMLVKFYGVISEGIKTCDVDIMQFTGLKDKNGKEIYEGDIVTYHDGNLKYEVGFKNGQFYGMNYNNEHAVCASPLGVWDDLELNYTACCEIIGNIYENPELIKESPNAKQ